MRFYRSQRVGALIEKELSFIIRRELEFPNFLVTITDVVIDKKLNNAMVMFSVYPSDKFKEAGRILRRNIYKLQFALNRKLNIRPMPRIEFQEDHGIERAAGVEKALLE